jgi:hypothetical protein
MAASSLLALVNGLDESNKFNQLDEMQNHMSKLITEQDGKVEATNKEDSEKINRGKKRSSASTDDIIDSSSSSEDENKTPHKGLKKQKIYKKSSSNSDNK